MSTADYKMNLLNLYKIIEKADDKQEVLEHIKSLLEALN